MDTLKRFVFNAILTETSLDQLASQGISVRGKSPAAPAVVLDETAFSPRILFDAATMSSVFSAFFSIENSVRALITERLLSRKGADWWNTAVPQKIRQAVERLREKEQKNRYHSPRAVELIGYTLFGNLSQIIIANWNEFSDLFPDQAWVTSRLNDLELSRNIIMHTGVLPQIEVDRIQSISRDWLSQIG